MADPHDFEELVLRHIDAENAKNTEGLRATYGEHARVVDVPSGRTYAGWPQIVGFYNGRWGGFPHASRTVQRVMTTEDGCYVEVKVTGKHEGSLQGLAASGQTATVSVCSFFEPDDAGLIASQTLYYDALSLLTQLGVLPDIGTTTGKAWLAMRRPTLALRSVAGRLRSGE